MVLTSLSRPLTQSAGRLASRTRGLHTVVSPAAATSLRSSTSRAAALASRQLPVTALAATTSTLQSKLGPSTAIRSLTSGKREKVKVLLVLYDGGQHAKDVSTIPIFTHSRNPGLVELELETRRNQPHRATCLLGSVPFLSFATVRVRRLGVVCGTRFTTVPQATSHVSTLRGSSPENGKKIACRASRSANPLEVRELSVIGPSWIQKRHGTMICGGQQERHLANMWRFRPEISSGNLKRTIVDVAKKMRCVLPEIRFRNKADHHHCHTF